MESDIISQPKRGIVFYMTICACSDSNREHRSIHNVWVANRLAIILSAAGKVSDEFKLKVTSCCKLKSNANDIPDHTKHFILLEVSEELLQHCISIMNHHFSDTFVDINDPEHATAVNKLTPGQQAWLGALSIRMVTLINDHKMEFRRLKSCTHYASVDKLTDVNKTDEDCLVSPTSNSALFCLKAAALTKEMTPLHEPEARDSVWRNICSLQAPFPAVNRLRWYLGDALGFYFAWLHYYCLALIIPAGVGLITWLSITISTIISIEEEEEINSPSGQPPLSPFRICYGLVTVVWAIGCTKVWRRQQSQLAEDWCSPAFTSAADFAWLHSPNDLRPEFRGTPRTSPITGEIDIYFPTSKRRMLYLLTGSITFLCVLIAIFVNVLLMNLEGLIQPGRSPYLHFYFASCWCEPGCIFDPINGSLNFIPTILHPLLIFVMNQILFRHIAEALTDIENHEIQADWDHSLIIKRFLFEAVDAYSCLFYLGFVLVDWSALQSMLFTIFATDSIRRLLIECGLPAFSSFWRSRKDQHDAGKAKKTDLTDDSMSIDVRVRRAQFGVLYEPFDDFLEMVLEHGYIVLFAFACPPYMAVMALVCAWVEAYFDSFKLLHIIRRPLPELLQRGQDIWLVLLSVQAWLCVFTNVLLLACCTEWSTGSLFCLEHILIGIGLCIELGISNTPIRAKNAYRARVYARSKRFTTAMNFK